MQISWIFRDTPRRFDARLRQLLQILTFHLLRAICIHLLRHVSSCFIGLGSVSLATQLNFQPFMEDVNELEEFHKERKWKFEAGTRSILNELKPAKNDMSFVFICFH